MLKTLCLLVCSYRRCFSETSVASYKKTRHRVTQHTRKSLCWAYKKLHGNLINSLKCRDTWHKRPHADMTTNRTSCPFETRELNLLDSWTLKMGPIGCPETSVRNYHYSLRNNQEERSSQQNWNTFMYHSDCLRDERGRGIVSWPGGTRLLCVAQNIHTACGAAHPASYLNCVVSSISRSETLTGQLAEYRKWAIQHTG